MAYLNFNDQLVEAKRRARLSGRPVSQQEMAGITEGSAAGAAQRVAASKNIALQEKQQETQKEQFGQTLATNKEQFGQSLATQKEQFGQTFEQQRLQNKQQYEIAVRTLEEQIRQFMESTAEQKRQFGDKMALEIQNSATQAKQFREKLDADNANFMTAQTNAQNNFNATMNFQKGTTAVQMAQAGQTLPAALYAPEGWNPARYLANNPDIANDPFYGRAPLNHWYLLGQGEGRSYK